MAENPKSAASLYEDGGKDRLYTKRLRVVKTASKGRLQAN